MKGFYTIFLCVFFLASCQTEEFTTVEGEEQAVSFLQDQVLKGLLKSVTSRDGSFDDIVDRSSCFSINFPYTILLNGSPHQVNTINDLYSINPTDEVTPIAPFSITFATYNQLNVDSLEDFQNLVQLCDIGNLFNDAIKCIDLVYPIEVSLYDSENRSFDTLVFNHDKESFLSIDAFSENTLASINFPIEVILHDLSVFQIESNEGLKNVILQEIPLCD